MLRSHLAEDFLSTKASTGGGGTVALGCAAGTVNLGTSVSLAQLEKRGMLWKWHLGKAFNPQRKMKYSGLCHPKFENVKTPPTSSQLPVENYMLIEINFLTSCQVLLVLILFI